MNKDNIIPPMTHPYGMCWQQPPTYLILIDDTHAVMSRLDFEILMDYTCSRPSALYNGKMWKAQYENEGALKWFLSSMKSKTATIFVSGNECLFLSTSFFLALLHGGSVPIIVGTMNNYVNFLFEIKTQPGVLLRPKR